MKRDNVATPSYILKALEEEFGPIFDPCPLNPDWNKETDVDGLAIPWGKFTFVNPPYSNVHPWLKKAQEEHALGNTVVLLLKINTLYRQYFEQYAGVELRFFNHRIQFPPYPTCAMFGSMLVVFGKNRGCYKMVDYRT